VLGEDQAPMRDGLVRLLERAGHEVVDSAADGPGVVRAANAHRPDLVIADVRMPPSQTDEGLRAALAIRASIPGIGILVLSHNVELRYAVELLAEDARGVGYLLKQRVAELGAFFTALDRIAAGASVVDPEVVAALLRRAHGDAAATLTTPQREVLALMTAGHTDAGTADGLIITEPAVAEDVAAIFETLGRLPGLSPAQSSRGPEAIPGLDDGPQLDRRTSKEI